LTKIVVPARLNTRTHRRLMPLYLTLLLIGFVMWYPISTLFMHKIGFDNAGIGVVGAICSAVMLVIAIPLGVLSDYWSRKGVLVLSAVALSASALIGGTSQSTSTYLVAQMVWAIYFAIGPDTFSAIICDIVLEEEGNKKHFLHYLSVGRIMLSVSLTLGSLVGGIIAGIFGLRMAYYMSVPMPILAIIPLAFLKGAKQMEKESTNLKTHVVNTFKAVLKSPGLVFIIITLIGLSVADRLLNEFSQLWLIAVATPVILYGPFNTLLLITMGVGSWFVNFLKLHKFHSTLIALVLIVLTSIGLAKTRSIAGVFVFTGVLAMLIYAVDVVFAAKLQKQFKSEVRNGATSVVSTFGRAVFIPFSVMFGYTSKVTNIFTATWILVGIALVISAVAVLSFRHTKTDKKVTIPLEKQEATA
jgi:MFS family permease